MIKTNPSMSVGPQHIGALAEARIEDLQKRQANPELYRPISFGIPEVDESIGGVVLPSLIAIGGAKKIGKTVVAVHLASQIAKSGRMVPKRNPDGSIIMLDEEEVVCPLRVVTFHLEETRWQYADRVITSLSKTANRTMIRDLTLTDAHFSEMKEVQQILTMQWEMYMDDSVFDVTKMIELTKALEAQVMVVDTFNLARGGKGTSVQEKLADMSSQLLYARNRDAITSIVIHHKNREGEDFGSDALGRDADLRITVSQPSDVICMTKGVEGILRLDTENSRQAKGGTHVDVAASFSQSKIMPLSKTSMDFPKMEVFTHEGP